MTAFDQDPGWRRSWCRHAGTLFGRPLRLHYDGLDREAAYKVRVVYTGDMFQVRVRLEADGSTEIHPYLLKPRDMTPLEFDVPRDGDRATGRSTSTWTAEPGPPATAGGARWRRSG